MKLLYSLLVFFISNLLIGQGGIMLHEISADTIDKIVVTKSVDGVIEQTYQPFDTLKQKLHPSFFGSSVYLMDYPYIWPDNINSQVDLSQIIGGAYFTGDVDPVLFSFPQSPIRGDLYYNFLTKEVYMFGDFGMWNKFYSPPQLTFDESTDDLSISDGNTVDLSSIKQWGEDGNDIYNLNTGDVGIGTSTPQEDLHLDGTFLLGTNNNDGTRRAIFSDNGFQQIIQGSNLINSNYVYTNGLNRAFTMRGHTREGLEGGDDLAASSLNNRVMYSFEGWAFDGSTYRRSAEMKFLTDGNIDGANMGLGKIQLKTSRNGSNNAQTVMELDSEGDVYFSNYGDGNKISTPTYLMGVLSNGRGVEVATSDLLDNTDVQQLNFIPSTNELSIDNGNTVTLNNGYWSFDNSSTNEVYVTGTTQIGIGTSTPDNSLHIESVSPSMRINGTTTSSDPYFQITDNLQEFTASTGARFYLDGGENKLSIRTTEASHINNEMMVFELGNDEIGINTNAPTETVDINGTLRVRGLMRDNNNSFGNTDQVWTKTTTGNEWSDPSVSLDLGRLTRHNSVNLVTASTINKFDWGNVYTSGLSASSATEDITISVADGSGAYLIGSTLTLDGGSGSRLEVFIYVDGVQERRFIYQNSNGTTETFSFSEVLLINISGSPKKVDLRYRQFTDDFGQSVTHLIEDSTFYVIKQK